MSFKAIGAFAVVSLYCSIGAAQFAAPITAADTAPASVCATPAAGVLPAANCLPAAILGAAPAAAAHSPKSADAGKANFNTPSAELPPLGTNQFASFVQEATGRSLPLYGYNLFGSNSFASLTNVPVPANYILGPGDDLSIKVWGAIDLNLNLPIDRNGQVTIPKVGPVTVAGTRADQIEPLLKAHISRVYNNYELSATLGRLRSIQVFVVGQARKPGVYTVSSLSTLISALFESGGPSATGSMRQISLVRGGKTVSTIDLYQFIHSGTISADARLLPGDVIVIPPTGARVALLGALDNPAIFELAAKEESLSQLLAYSGGQQVLTTPHKVLVERINHKDGTPPRSVEERSLTPTGLASTVRDGDVITLFRISPQFANAVTLRGNVAVPLRYAFRQGMKVSDLIPEVSALIQGDYYTRKNHMVQFESGKKVSSDRVINEVKNLLEEINWDYAAIERLDAKEVRTTLVPFNLGKAVKDHDPAHNLTLQAGDVITIFGVNDLPVPLEKRTQFVSVGGEVMVPGVYQLQAGETLPDLIKRAGGFSRNAFPYGTVFTRESTRAQQQVNLDKSVRQMEAAINSEAITNMQNVTDSEKTTSLQSQLTGQRIMLRRLQGLKASGRIALELDPDSPLPPPSSWKTATRSPCPTAPALWVCLAKCWLTPPSSTNLPTP
jgi:protein involved in polysaccharide export with SLBB domain